MGNIERCANIAAAVGYPVDLEAATILDFGCGIGHTVVEGKSRGLKVFGADIPAGLEGAPSDLLGSVLRLIDEKNYRLPFDDNQFDLIFSHQVLEHVMDYDAAFREIRRVLKPGGVTVHIFPSRHTPVETHVWVPLGTMIRTQSWLYFWASMGIRNEFQKGLTARHVAELNHAYLNNETIYLTRSQIRREIEKHFQEVRFAEREFLASGSRYGPLLSRIPLFPAFFAKFVQRVVVTR
jgi:SAM-dependent methyltransferase